MLENSWNDMMLSSGAPLNHCKVVSMSVPTNILQRTASDPPKLTFERERLLDAPQGPLLLKKVLPWEWGSEAVLALP